MSKFIFLGNADTGAQGFAISQAIDKYTKHDAGALRMMTNYIQFPYDLSADQGGFTMDGEWVGNDGVKEMLSDADILVFDTYDRFKGWGVLIENFYPGKRVIYRHNGDQCRKYNVIVSGFHKRNQDSIVVSTPDLLGSLDRVDNVKYIPNCPIWPEKLDEVPKPEWEKDEFLKIVHSPTNPKRKGTFKFMRALEESGNPKEIIFNPMGDEAWMDIIFKRTREGHVYFDQITDDIEWYGNASVEASWVGQPVICNELFIDIDVPFYPVNFENLTQQLRDYRERLTREKYRELQRKHMNWVREYHDPKRLAEEHVNWMVKNAKPWTEDHGYLTDAVLLIQGWKWKDGKGVKVH